MTDLSWYSDLGWHTFPVRYRGKRPLTTNGFLDATLSTDWRLKAPNCNVGVACEASGIIVIDVDPRNGGDDSLGQLPHPLPDCPTQRTGGGGWHYVFRRPALQTSYRSTLGPGVDVKHNGYILVEPSVTSAPYVWDCVRHSVDMLISDLFSWLLWMLARPAQQPQPITGPAAESVTGLCFRRAGLVMSGVDLGPEKMAVHCPLAAAHSTSSPTGTVVFAPTARNPLGSFHCSHTSHQRISTYDALKMLGGNVWDH